MTVGDTFTVDRRDYKKRRFQVTDIDGVNVWCHDLDEKCSNRWAVPSCFRFHARYLTESPDVKVLKREIERAMAAVEFLGAGETVPYDAGTEGLNFQTG